MNERLNDVRDSLRGLLLTAGPFALLTVALLALAFWVLKPHPPRHVVLATGVENGAYDRFGHLYAAWLKAHGITVEMRQTGGAAENLALLRRPDSGVDIAFVQGGADDPDAPTFNPKDGLLSLGNLFYEPVWLFYRRDAAERHLGRPELNGLDELKGWTVNVGEAGSGVPPLMRRMLAANRMDEAGIRLSEQALTPAVIELIEGRLDALVMASAPESSIVQMLLQTPGIRLQNFAQAEAYSRRFPFLSAVTLPRGVVDLALDRPPQDVHLVAPTATLLARPDLHPALVQLFMQAAADVHGGAGWFQRKGDFPNAGDTERPLSDEAARYYRTGTPWLQRYLPFWLANLADRMWVVLVAIVAVLIPLSRVLPPLYEFRVRSRVFRWYGRLREVESEAQSGGRPTHALLATLAEIEANVDRTRVPLSHADELYALKTHIQMVKQQVLNPAAPTGQTVPAAPTAHADHMASTSAASSAPTSTPSR